MSRPVDPSYDPRIAEWLEGDPDRAPREVLRTVLAAYTSIPQRHASRVPWRSTPVNRIAILGVAAALVAAVGLGGLALTSRQSTPNVGTGPTASPVATAVPSPTPTPSPSARLDYSDLPGRILVEHLGNALDLSESDTTDYNPDKRRFYFMDPADMTSRTVTEFLPGQPTTGKFAADVSADGRKVVFQDWAPKPRLFEANLDGTGFHQLPISCDCQLLYPDYDPAATRVVYTRIEGTQSWLETADLASGKVTPLPTTRGPASDNVPEQPAWSPDGRTIAFTRLRWDARNPAVVGTVRYGDQAPSSGVLSLLDLATGKVRDLALPAGSLPGDANWSPDSGTILYTSSPASTTGSDSGMPPGSARSIGADGTGHRVLPGWGGPQYTPDGAHILVQSNTLDLMNPDGSNFLSVNRKGIDLSGLNQGFVYIAHWLATP